jgi:CBS domain-containing protein
METVGQTMHRGVISCAPQSSLATIAGTMAAHRIHCVVVPGYGIVTDAELTAALDCMPLATAATLARPAPVLEQSDSLELAAARLHADAVTHALVVEPQSGRVVGVLSTLDLANALALR